jgi:tetratricopeptide (TPR) repeat protein
MLLSAARTLLLFAFSSLIFFCSADTYMVVPFINSGPDASLDWIGDSISEAVIDALAEAEVSVLSRSELQSGFALTGIKNPRQVTQASMIKVGDRLDAGFVLMGDFDYEQSNVKASKLEGTLKIQARLIGVKQFDLTNKIEFQGRLADLPQVLNEFSWMVLSFAAKEKAGLRENYLKKRPTANVSALESYTRGLKAERMEQRSRLFANAAKLDPTFGKPALELGLMAFERKQYRSAADWFYKVPPTMRRGREAMFFQALARFHLGDFVSARSLLEKIAAEVPVNEVWNNLGIVLQRLGEPGAWEILARAREGDPSDPDYAFNLGLALWKAGRSAEAVPHLQAALSLQPEDSLVKTVLETAKNQTAADPALHRELLQKERLKDRYNESVYLQLKALIDGPRNSSPLGGTVGSGKP